MTGLHRYFADLHVHLGRAGDGQPVKIAASRDLTLARVLAECRERKGIEMVGVVDAASPAVLSDLRRMIDRGELAELPGGGFTHQGGVTLIPGCELESREDNGGRAHFVSYFPGLAEITEFSDRLRPLVTNLNLSSQTAYLPGRGILDLAAQCGGFVVPAHVFTPFRSVYGKAARRLADLFPEPGPVAVELGLSADTDLGDRIAELAACSFLSNSDAHSAGRIAREYNVLELAGPDFRELLKALRCEGGRRVAANYGLDPRLGKYHRTLCRRCGASAADLDPPVVRCPQNPDHPVVVGVLDRITEIADSDRPHHPPDRPPYCHQIPLEFIPGVGARTLETLIAAFGSEMAVLHRAAAADLVTVVGAATAGLIILAREGRLALRPGGGGIYGRVLD